MKNTNKILLVIGIYLTAALAANLARAEVTPKDLAFTCVTEFPTTSFIGVPSAGKIAVRLINSNGVQFMPISAHIVTTHDLGVLAKRSLVYKNIGDEATFDFDLKNCEVYEDDTFRCHSGSKFKGTQGDEVEAVSIYTKLLTSQALGWTFKNTQLTASFKIKGEYYDVPMNYDVHDCAIQIKK